MSEERQGDLRESTAGSIDGVTADHIAVRAVRQGSGEGSSPGRRSAVDSDESSSATTERDPIVGGRLPVVQRGGTDGPPEPNHGGDRQPTVLAQPSTGSSAARATSCTVVRSTGIKVAPAVPGQNAGLSVGVGQGEDVGENVGVVGRVVL